MSPAKATASATVIAPIPALSPREAPTATILVIEDYSDTRELLAALLRRRGYNVIEAEDGVEGLLKAGWVYPDLIIMDLSLPEMDGVEAARRIHAQAKLSQIPIFVVSAYLTEAVKADVRAAGCVEIFSKPFDAEALLESVSKTLINESV
jgi:two-component system, cell cycle response regulator DivK